MTRKEYKSIITDLIYLAACVVKGEIPDRDRVTAMDLNLLYTAANRHKLTAIIAAALESAGIADADFVEAQAKAKRKCALFSIEANRITEKFEEAGIWYMPLKGLVIKELYPYDWMRQMADVDILFDGRYREQVKDIMTERGFTAVSYGGGNHDCYEKPPVYEFEMHNALFGNSDNNIDAPGYYAEAENMLLQGDTGKYSRKFSDEDFYLYMIAHEHKHYYSGGVGFRVLLDIYVYWRQLGESLNKEYLKKESEKLGIAEFEKKNRELAFAVFEGKEVTKEQTDMLEYMLFSGSNGTWEHWVENMLKANGTGIKAKIKYSMKRVFLPMEVIETRYPLLYKHKLLLYIVLPVLPFYRFAGQIFRRGSFLRCEIRTILKRK